MNKHAKHNNGIVTQEEEYIARLTFDGMPTGEIARNIKKSEAMVRTLRMRFYAKTGTKLHTIYTYFQPNPIKALYETLQEKHKKDMS